MKKNKKILIIAIIIIIAIIFIGISFAFVKVNKNQSSINTASTLCLNIAFDEDEDSAIGLNKAQSMTDEEGLSLVPYTFTVTNKCSDSVGYLVNLDILTDLSDSSSLQLQYIKVSLNGKKAKLLSEYKSTSTNVDNAYSSKNLYKGTLEGNESVSYELRLWIDEKTSAENGANKLFSSKIVVINDKIIDKTNMTLATYITELAKMDEDDLVYDETEDVNIRYVGADPDNYLCFDSDCSTGVWRVIGVMNNIQTELNETQSLVKIIKATSIGTYAWDDAYNTQYSTYYGNNDWSIASLQISLNSGDLYNQFISKYSEYFQAVVWNIGGYNFNNVITPPMAYTAERGSDVYEGNATTWTGKVALMYPSDWSYAVSKNYRESCLNLALINWSSNINCRNDDYLSFNYYYWTLSHSATDYSFLVGFIPSGYSFSRNTASTQYAVHPSGYLVSTVKIVSGDGTSDNPWIIGI